MVELIPPFTDNVGTLSSWFREVLRELGVRPRKKLGQVFLLSPGFLRKIAEAVYAVGGDKGSVVEIGVGVGNLTRFVLEIASPNMYVGIEIDERFHPILKEMQRVFASFNAIIGDARFVLEALRNVDIVIGNIPYNITSDILLKIARSNCKACVITTQKEVAERLTSKPGSKSYGKLTIVLGLLFDIDILHYIPAKNFIPVPEVDSATLVMVRKSPFNEQIERLERLVLCVFSRRRKKLRKALKSCLRSYEFECVRARLGEDKLEMRVDQIGTEDYLTIAEVCMNGGGRPAQGATNTI